jgi:hypothetical protein
LAPGRVKIKVHIGSAPTVFNIKLMERCYVIFRIS